MLITRFLILVFLLFSLTGAEKVWGQTYTSNSNGNWNTPATWTRTNTAECGGTIPNTPPVATNNRACPVIVIINHNVSRPGGLTVGNNNIVTIQIAANRTLSIGNDFGITGYGNKNLTISGSGFLEVGKDFNVGGNNNIELIGNLNIEVGRNTNIIEASQFAANGNIRFFSKQVTVNGNGSLNFSALTNTIFETTDGDFIVRNGSNILFSGSSGLISDRDLRIFGFTPNVRFEGNTFLETQENVILEEGGNLTLNGGSEMEVGKNLIMEGQSRFFINDNSQVTIQENVSLKDQSVITANNNSVIDIEGKLELENQSTLTMSGSSSIVVEEDVTVTTNNQLNGIRFNDDSNGTFNSTVRFDGSASTLFTSGSPSVQFGSNVIFENGADAFFYDDSEVNFNSNVRISDNGTTFNSTGTSRIIIGGNTILEDGADVNLSEKTNVNFKGNLSFDNQNGTTWTNTQFAVVLVEGDFSKGNNSYLIINNSGLFEICTGTFPIQSSNPRIITDPSPAFYGGCRILPVEYLYFNLNHIRPDRTGELNWVTTQEWESSHFEIERSVFDVKSWTVIDQVESFGYSDVPIEYSFLDTDLPASGGNIFYRLKQVDFDGSFTYSITKAIQVSPLAGTTNWRVYPNPTTGDFINLEMIDKGAFQDEKITVRIISVTGQYDLIEAHSLAQLSGQLSNALSGKSAGVYTLEVTWDKKKEYHKVILNR